MWSYRRLLFVRQNGSSLPILEVCGFRFRQFSGSGDHIFQHISTKSHVQIKFSNALYSIVNNTGNRNRILEMCKFRFRLLHWIDPRSIVHSYACDFNLLFRSFRVWVSSSLLLCLLTADCTLTYLNWWTVCVKKMKENRSSLQWPDLDLQPHDYDECHVTSFQPINGARSSWSYDNIQMMHDSECNISLHVWIM